jgi:hypothetical protein
MTLVLIASQPGGTIQDLHGDARSPSVEFRLANGTVPDHFDGTLVATYTDALGTGSSTAAFAADSRGRLMRYIATGAYKLIINPSDTSARESLDFHATPGSVDTDLSLVATYAATREKVETFVIGANAVGVTTYYPLKIVDRDLRITGLTITNATTLTLSAANWWSVRPKNFRDGVELDVLDNTEWGNVGTYILGAADVTTITANLSYILPSTFSQYASMRPGDILKMRLASNGTPTALSGFVVTFNYREL